MYVREKEYAVKYVLSTPPKFIDSKVVWKQAFFEYLRRQGIKNPEKLTKVDNVEWNEVIRIYNTLVGKHNRDRKPGFMKTKNKDLIAAGMYEGSGLGKDQIEFLKKATRIVQGLEPSYKFGSDKLNNAYSFAFTFGKKSNKNFLQNIKDNMNQALDVTDLHPQRLNLLLDYLSKGIQKSESFIDSIFKNLNEMKWSLLEYTAQDVKDAYALLNVPFGEYDQVEKAFKTMAMKNHPDRGGSVEMMQKINHAKDVIDANKHIGPRNSFDPEEYKKRKEAEKAQWEKEAQVFINKVKPSISKYDDYFNQYFKVGKTDITHKVSDYGWNVIIKVPSEDKKSYFQISVHDMNRFGHNNNPKLGEADKDVYFTTFAYNNGKEYPMAKKRYKDTVNYADFTDPSKLFPKAKLDKVFTAEKKPMKKRDWEAAIQVELGGKHGGKGFMWIPLSGDRNLVIFRSTFMGQSAWMTNGIYNKTFPIGRVKYQSFPESHEGFATLKQFVDDLNAGKVNIGPWKNESLNLSSELAKLNEMIE